MRGDFSGAGVLNMYLGVEEPLGPRTSTTSNRKTLFQKEIITGIRIQRPMAQSSCCDANDQQLQDPRAGIPQNCC